MIPAPEPAPSLGKNAGLGITQIILWGGSYFLMALIAGPVAQEQGWARGWVAGSLSLAILVSGLLAPMAGQAIRRHGGRPVLMGGALILALGLVLMTAAPNLPLFMAAWAVMGVGMAGCLYDPLFSAIGQAYGPPARSAMTQVALISGFALTLCWPAGSWLMEAAGWRVVCLVYAALDATLVIAVFAWALPKEQRPPGAASPGGGSAPAPVQAYPGLLRLGVAFTLAAMIMTSVSVELLSLLQSQGVTAATAVALGALIGPSQVGVRLLEMALGRRAHPWFSLVFSATGFACALLLLALAPGWAWLAIILYGMGNGMRTIVRGSLPLTMYGPQGFADAMGRLGRPALIAQALTPLGCSLLLDRAGPAALLAVLVALALLNLAMSLALRPVAMPRSG